MSVLYVVTALAVLVPLVAADGHGSFCGDRKCQDEVAECVDDVCECIEGYVGDGDIGCQRDSHVVSDIKNDPAITDYNRIGANFPFPCRYLTTHVRSRLKMKVDGERTQVGVCEIQIHPWHKKRKGKFFVGGLDVAIKINFFNPEIEDIRATLRVYGNASGGVYNFEQDGSSTAYLPDGQPLAGETVDITRGGVTVKFEENDQFQQVLDIPKCGFTASFRPFDEELGKDQVYVPGVSMAIDCAKQPIFLSPDKVMSLPPINFGGTTTYTNLTGDGLTKEQKVLLRALTAGADVTQSQPKANPQCAQSIMIMDECDDRQEEAVKTCSWLLHETKFIRCYDKTSNAVNILNVFNECIAAICQDECAAFSSFFQAQANEAECEHVDGSDTLAAWLSGEGCSPE